MANEVQVTNGSDLGLVSPQPQQQQLLPSSWIPMRPTSLNEALMIAKVVADSDLAPKDFRGKPANVLVAFQLGAELGLAPMQALQNIAVINGRPSVWGDAALALVRASGKLEKFVETDDGETATCTVKRRGEAEELSTTFSMKDATIAGLVHKDTWKQYPKRMRQMRARAFRLRDSFTDVLKGVAIAEESMDIEATATVVASSEPSPAPAPPEERKSTTEKLKERLAAKTAAASPAQPDPLLTQKEVQGIIIVQKECGVDDDSFKAHLAQEYGINSRTQLTRDMAPTVKGWLQAEGVKLWRTRVDAALFSAGISETDYLYYLLKVLAVEKEDDLTPAQRASVLVEIGDGAVAGWLLSQN